MSRAMRQISGRVKVKPAILDSDLAPQPQHQHYILFFFCFNIHFSFFSCCCFHPYCKCCSKKECAESCSGLIRRVKEVGNAG